MHALLHALYVTQGLLNGLELEELRIREKGLTCSASDKTFTRTEDFEGHEIVHTGEKPFTCWLPDI